MLDAYIIEQIRKKRERPDSGLQPLHIEVPRHPPSDRVREDDRRRSENRKPEKETDRGVAIIDYSI